MIQYIIHQLLTTWRIAFNQKEQAENIDNSTLAIKLGLVAAFFGVLLARIADIWFYESDLEYGLVPETISRTTYGFAHGITEIIGILLALAFLVILAKPAGFSNNLKRGIVANCWWSASSALLLLPILVPASLGNLDDPSANFYFFATIIASLLLIILSVNVLRHSLNVGIWMAIGLSIMSALSMFVSLVVILPLFGIKTF